MNWTTDALLSGLYRHEQEKRCRILEGSQEHKRSLQREALKAALGTFPDRSHPLGSQLLKRIDYGDYTLEEVAYTTMEDVFVPVIVLLPKGVPGPWPVVLACHGHGNGYLDAIGRDEEGREWADPGIHNRFAARLAERGMAVVVPEIMGFGTRRMTEELKANPNYSSCGTLASQLLMYGRTLAGMRVFEAIRAIDYIASRDDMDSERIGAFGFSGGGLIASYASALDERVKATVLCGWTNTFQGSILAMHHCIDNYLPGLLLSAEQPELAGLTAPRALFVETGESDPIFPVNEARQAIQALESIYLQQGAADRFAWDVHPGGHEISGTRSFEWLRDTLQNPAERRTTI